MKKRIITGIVILLIGITSLFLSRNLIFNYVYGPHRTAMMECIGPFRPSYYKTFGLQEEYFSITGYVSPYGNPVYETSASGCYYLLTRSGGYVVLRTERIKLQNPGDRLTEQIQRNFSGLFVSPDYKNPEEQEVKKRLDAQFDDNEYPIMYFDATADVSGKKTLAWFQYITSGVLIVGGFLLLFAGLFFGRKKTKAA